MIEDIETNNGQSIGSLIFFGAPISIQIQHQIGFISSSLAVAIKYKKYEIMEILLNLGAKITEKCNVFLQTPLDFAAYGNDKIIINKLINYNNNNDKHSDEVEEQILKFGKFMREESNEYDLSLMHAFASINLENFEWWFKFLENFGVSLAAVDKKLFQPFHFAAKYGNMKFALKMMELGVDINIFADESISPLFFSSWKLSTWDGKIYFINKTHYSKILPVLWIFI